MQDIVILFTVIIISFSHELYFRINAQRDYRTISPEIAYCSNENNMIAMNVTLYLQINHKRLKFWARVQMR